MHHHNKPTSSALARRAAASRGCWRTTCPCLTIGSVRCVEMMTTTSQSRKAAASHVIVPRALSVHAFQQQEATAAPFVSSSMNFQPLHDTSTAAPSRGPTTAITAAPTEVGQSLVPPKLLLSTHRQIHLSNSFNSKCRAPRTGPRRAHRPAAADRGAATDRAASPNHARALTAANDAPADQRGDPCCHCCRHGRQLG